MNSYPPRTDRRNLEQEAAAVGCRVVEASGRYILVDLDSQQDQYVMEAVLALFAKNGYEIMVDRIERSRNGNKHAYLLAPESLTDMQRVLLQAVLGSDRKREALAFLRIKDGHRPVSVFFEKQA